jgi:hypothetical protein
MMQALKDVGFAGHVTMECGFAGRDVDPDDQARRALAYLRGIEQRLR